MSVVPVTVTVVDSKSPAISVRTGVSKHWHGMTLSVPCPVLQLLLFCGVPYAYSIRLHAPSMTTR